jgi:predicted enzyme related to lactoylglutathione lyase
MSLLALWPDGAFGFVTGPTTGKGQNLANNPQWVLTTSSTMLPVPIASFVQRFPRAAGALTSRHDVVGYAANRCSIPARQSILWCPGHRRGAFGVPNPVVHFEIIGNDGPTLQKFYDDLFGWNVDANNEFQYGMVSAQGDKGIGGGIGADMGGGQRVSIYVEVDDPQAYLDKVEQLGGKTIMPPATIMDGVTIAMFTDPEGNVTGLVKNAA